MILDKMLELSDKQAITASAVSTNVIDAGGTKSPTMGRDIGAGTAMYAVLTINTAMAAAGAATLTLTLQDSDDNATFVDRVSTAAIPVADLVAGRRVNLPIPPGMRRYIRGNYTVGTGPFTGGTVSLHVVDGIDFARQYPAAP